MLNALEVVTTVIVGVTVGVEFSVAFVINPILNALPEDSDQLDRAHGGRMLGAVMPVWYIARSSSSRSGPSPDGATTASASSSPPARC